MEQNNTNTEQTQEIVTESIVQSAESLASKFKRNSLGLLDSAKYKFTDTGEIDWRSMVDPKYLYLNTDNFNRRKEAVPSSIDGVADKDLIIQLPGLRNLAILRGFTSVTYRPITATNEYAATVCQINWIGNFETNFQPVVYEDMACANFLNVGEMVSSYLVEMSANRAFCRAVRNFLKIFIVSKEELPPQKMKTNNSNNSEPAVVLANLMKEKGKTFEDVMKKLVGEGYTEFGNYKNWSDIPGDKCFNLIDRFKNLKGRG